MFKNRKLVASALIRSLGTRKSLPTHISSYSSYSYPHSCRFSFLHPYIEAAVSDRLFSDAASGRRNFCSKSADVSLDRCWNCGKASPASPAPFLSCGSCGSVQPVDHSVDYFQIFGLEKGFDMPGEDLESKYKNWQKKLHPDLVHSKSEEERTYAAEQSARVIDAYRTLGNPLSRALYLVVADET